MTKRASASGEHAKDAKDPDSIDEKAIHETGPVKSQLSIDEKAIHETGPVKSQLPVGRVKHSEGVPARVARAHAVSHGINWL